jgi:ADP-heptose:LPS heptosyltransferase
VDFQGLYRSAVLTWLSGARRRIGRDRTTVRQPGAERFYREHVVASGRHIAEMSVSLAVCAGGRQQAEMQFPLRVPAEETQRVRQKLLEEGIRAYVVMSPGGGWTSKRWPPERFGALCAELWRRHALRAVINVSPREKGLAEDLLRATGTDVPATARPMVVCPALPELAALLAGASLVIGGDTGPVHLAAALGTRVVALFGSTDPARNGPLPRGLVVQNVSIEPRHYERGDYERGRKHSPAMLSITVDQVLAAIEQEMSVTA